ncbi:MAG: triose-phosphate isomerase [Candidatus Andersenbacteria bacterium]|nr:triose-phosphate isomerase [Candidatus Andersenbacteria bacterium]
MLTDNSKLKYIIANWKMNPVSFVEADNLIKTIKKGIKKSNNLEIIICPPAVYLSKIKTNSSFSLGIQDISWEDSGAYTGEISAKMAKNIGTEYAIIGHSERRKYLRETDEMVNLKIQSALKNNLSPILCIGETLEEKHEDKASEAIIRQIEKDLKNISKFKIQNSKFKIAYEPIWAIGSGETPSINEIMSTCLLIKKIISNLYDRETAGKISILYGGSVNSKNAYDFVDKAGMDGLLIGGASLNGSEFARIVNLFG